ncbi:hypothetical protein SPHINGO361_100015 [Sphingomonas sp. EC-HK361]|nr:hypothetical protein SPHINGO361_100015 [Sphingomonas sp. EC-HK361]
MEKVERCHCVIPAVQMGNVGGGETGAEIGTGHEPSLARLWCCRTDLQRYGRSAKPHGGPALCDEANGTLCGGGHLRTRKYPVHLTFPIP